LFSSINVGTGGANAGHGMAAEPEAQKATLDVQQFNNGIASSEFQRVRLSHTNPAKTTQ
jgi:hypothetical protein